MPILELSSHTGLSMEIQVLAMDKTCGRSVRKLESSQLQGPLNTETPLATREGKTSKLLKSLNSYTILLRFLLTVEASDGSKQVSTLATIYVNVC